MNLLTKLAFGADINLINLSLQKILHQVYLFFWSFFLAVVLVHHSMKLFDVSKTMNDLVDQVKPGSSAA